MSKPDPSITANLLKSVPTRAETHPEGDPKLHAKGAHAEAHGGPAPKSAIKPKAGKAGAGPQHMRSSNRGK